MINEKEMGDRRYPIPAYHKERNHLQKVDRISTDVVTEVLNQCKPHRNWSSQIEKNTENFLQDYFRIIKSRVTQSWYIEKEYNLKHTKKVVAVKEFDKNLKKENDESLNLLLERMQKINLKKKELESELTNAMAKRITEKVSSNKTGLKLVVRSKSEIKPGDNTQSHSKEMPIEQALEQLFSYQKRYLKFYEGLFEQLQTNFESTDQKAKEWLGKIYNEQEDKAKIINFLKNNKNCQNLYDMDQNNQMLQE